MPESLASFQQAASHSPDDINRWIDLCEQAEKAGDYAEVLRAGDEIVRIAPGRPQAHFIRGLALHRLDRIEEAIEAYRRVLALDPNYLDACINLGECCQFLNRIDDAEIAYRRTIEISGQASAGGDYDAHYWNLALIELLKGDLRAGFEHYPARFKALAHKKRPAFPQPLWRGEDLRGKAILITVDQGHGDTLMMARYLPLLRARGARVLLQAQAPLVTFFKQWDGADQILNASHDALPFFDYHAWEFDLPRLFGTTLAAVPAPIPYLPLLPPDEKTRLPDNGKPKIGVCWAGNPGHRNDQRRSIPLADFKFLFAATGVEFFSLNRDPRAGDAELLAALPVTDLAPRLEDFAATAAFINQLDLVITCDTAIAHLAGGMGKPIWILLPFAPSWHWMLEREDSPWYPTARLFRQKTRGDWDEVMGRVAAALAERGKSV